MKTGSLLLILFFIIPLSKSFAQSSEPKASGTYLLEERFVENDRGWNLGDDNNVKRSIENGKLTIECKKTAGGGYWIKCPDFKLPATNYSVSVNTTWIKNQMDGETYSPYGLILGDYYFLIYADGDRRLLKYDAIEKKYEPIVDWGVNSALNKYTDGDNKLEIQYKDGRAALFANGEMLFRKELSFPEGTTVKLYIEKTEVVSYDDLVVKML